MLERVLFAYSLHDPHVGYAQSMNYIAALLLVIMKNEQVISIYYSLFKSIIQLLTYFLLFRIPFGH